MEGQDPNLILNSFTNMELEDENMNATTSEDEQRKGLLDLPDLVHIKILGHMLSRLDLLKLRITCKTTCQWATNILIQKYNAGWTNLVIVEEPEQIESLNEMTLEQFLLCMESVSGIPCKIKKLYIKNQTSGIFENPSMVEFLELYGSGIQKLKLEIFSITSTFQRQFFTKLINLCALKIHEIDARTKDKCWFSNCPEKIEASIPPETLKGIRSLKINTIFGKNILDTDYHEVFLGKFPHLEILRYPFICYDMARGGMNPGSHWRFLKNYIENQSEKVLKRIEMKNLNDYENDIMFSSTDFGMFSNYLYENKNLGIKLSHVNEKWLNDRRRRNPLVNPPAIPMTDFYWNIISMKNLSQNLNRMNNLDLMNLKSLDFSVAESIMTSSDGIGFGDGEINGNFWMYLDNNLLENLEKLRINYDITVQQLEAWKDSLEDMNEYIFGNEYRRQVVELSVTFSEDLRSVKMPAQIFRAVDISFNFDILKKLELVNWNPGNKSFLRLWTHMTSRLEELILKDCPSLGNVGFIGENEAAPVFLQLVGLKKLTLKVDHMKKLTDRCFKDVFRKMGLEEFHLISESPMDMITRSGIEWLLNGKFAETIQKFPFTTWSATTILPQDMMDLKSKFKNLIY